MTERIDITDFNEKIKIADMRQDRWIEDDEGNSWRLIGYSRQEHAVIGFVPSYNGHARIFVDRTATDTVEWRDDEDLSSLKNRVTRFGFKSFVK